MKSAKLLNVLVLGVLLATVAAGCKKQPKNITNIPGRDVNLRGDGMNAPIGGGNQVGLDGGGTRPLANGELPEAKTGEQDRQALATQTIYFGFDRSSIQPSEQGKLDAVATYLKNTPNVQLLVEGHCDERGSEEYNLGLGDRRANAVKNYLISLGIDAGRINPISYGKERPQCREATEDCYQKNRRGHFVMTGR